MSDLDLRAYVITAAGEPDTIIDNARAAARGGAGVIQVRSKPISARALTSLARALATEVAAVNPSTRVLIDDRVDVALALRAEGVPVHGVHVGQDDLDVRQIRRLLGPDAVIGLTTGTSELVRATEEVADVIDYIGCGPMRATPTKDSGRPPLGLDAYPALVSASPVPVVAIGGVTADDAAGLAATGVAGVAIVRGFAHADDPAAYAQRITEAFREVA